MATTLAPLMAIVVVSLPTTVVWPPSMVVAMCAMRVTASARVAGLGFPDRLLHFDLILFVLFLEVLLY